MSNINTDIIDPNVASNYAKGAFDTVDATLPFSKVLPNHAINSLPDGMSGDGNMTVSWIPNQRHELGDNSKYRAWDAEVPYGKTVGGKTIKRTALMPLSSRVRISERDIVSLGTEATSMERVEERIGQGSIEVAVKLEKLRIQALTTGTIKIDENNVTNSLDFGRSKKLSAAVPVKKWDDAASDPVIDVMNWAQLIVDNDGARPRTMLITRKILTALMTNGTMIKYRYGSFTATNPAPSITSDEVFGVFAGRTGINQIIVVDDLYDEFFMTQHFENQTMFPDNMVLLLPGTGDSGIGATVFGETAESRLGIIPESYGPFACVQDGQGNVPNYEVYVTEAVLPILAKPDSTLAVTVL